MADIPLPVPSPFGRPAGPITTAPPTPMPAAQAPQGGRLLAQPQMTPQQAEAMQAYAKAMDEQAYSQAKNQWGVPGGISHPLQGVAKMIQAWMGGRAQAMAGQGAAQGIRSATVDPLNPIAGATYGGGGIAPPATPTPSTPQVQTLGTGGTNWVDNRSLGFLPFTPGQWPSNTPVSPSQGM